MKHSFVLLSLALFLVALLFLALSGAPYYLYYKIKNGQTFAPWYVTSIDPQIVHSGKLYKSNPKTNLKHLGKEWDELHLSNYLIPYPKKSKLYYVWPTFKEVRQVSSFNIYIGLKYIDLTGDKIVTIQEKPTKTFTRFLNPHKIFHVPYVRKLLSERPLEKIWDDLFLIDPELSRFNTSLSSYKDSLYKLFIIHLRQIYFPKKFRKIQYFKERKIGLVEIERSARKIVEMMYYLDGDRIYRFKITLNSTHPESKTIRSIILENIEYERAYPQIGEKMYEDFLGWPYLTKRRLSGILHLFTAWSQSFLNTKILGHLIHILEEKKIHTGLQMNLYRLFNRFQGNRAQVSRHDITNYFKQLEKENKMSGGPLRHEGRSKTYNHEAELEIEQLDDSIDRALRKAQEKEAKEGGKGVKRY